MEKLEKSYEKRFINGVESLGGLCVKFWPLSFAGFPDRLIFLPGGIFRLAELKKPSGRKSTLQDAIHKRLAKLGFHVSVLWNDEDVDKELKIYKFLMYANKM